MREASRRSARRNTPARRRVARSTTSERSTTIRPRPRADPGTGRSSGGGADSVMPRAFSHGPPDDPRRPGSPPASHGPGALYPACAYRGHVVLAFCRLPSRHLLSPACDGSISAPGAGGLTRCSSAIMDRRTTSSPARLVWPATFLLIGSLPRHPMSHELAARISPRGRGSDSRSRCSRRRLAPWDGPFGVSRRSDGRSRPPRQLVALADASAVSRP